MKYALPLVTLGLSAVVATLVLLVAFVEPSLRFTLLGLALAVAALIWAITRSGTMILKSPEGTYHAYYRYFGLWTPMKDLEPFPSLDAAIVAVEQTLTAKVEPQSWVRKKGDNNTPFYESDNGKDSPVRRYVEHAQKEAAKTASPGR